MNQRSPQNPTTIRNAAGLALLVLAGAQVPAARAESLTDISGIYALADQKYTAYYNSISSTNLKNLGSAGSPPTIFPAYTTPGTAKDGWSTLGAASDWRAGFYAGVLWEIYADNGSSAVKTMAQNFTFGVRNNVAVGDHDVGFRTLPSYGLGAQLVGGNTTYTYQGVTDASYNSQIEAAADHLAGRYIPAVGATRSWDTGPTTQTEVIVDNMMNLQVLYEATAIGDTTKVDGLSLMQIAINHARTTFTDFVRPDGSSVHEVVFNTSTGAIMYKQSVQGITSFGQWIPGASGNQPYATEGCWSRGESWLINGFTQMYNETQMPEFLTDAQDVANYWVKRTLQNVAAGDSYVPPTDFDVALVGVADDVNHQDSSAGAIAADGLLQLAAVTSDPTLRAQYWSVAVNTLDDLLSPTYFSSDPTYGALLMHGANAFSTAGENSSLVYGDYYLLDALDRYQTLAPSFVPEPTSMILMAFPIGITLLGRRRTRAFQPPA